MAALVSGCQQPPPTGDLLFRQRAGDGTLTTLDAKFIDATTSYRWGTDYLNGALTSAPANSVEVWYQSDALRSEVHVLAFDPDEHHRRMTLFPGAQALTLDEAPWHALNARPGDGLSVELPDDVVIPFPNEDVPFGPYVTQKLSSSMFFGNDVPGPIAGTPNGNGAVRSARIHNIGACASASSMRDSTPSANDGLLAQISDQFHNEFIATLAEQGIPATRRWTHANAFVRTSRHLFQPAESSFGPGAPGGFFFGIQYDLDLPFPFSDVTVTSGVSFHWGLHAAVSPPGSQTFIPFEGILSVIPETHGTFADGNQDVINGVAVALRQCPARC